MVMEYVRATSFIRRSTDVGGPVSHRTSVAGLSQRLLTPTAGDRFAAPSPDTLFEPQRIEYDWATNYEGIKTIVLGSRISWLLFFVPIGLLATKFGLGDCSVFVLNFLALIPLAHVLGGLTEELALHTGDVVGGLLNATFGNAVEMIITVNALRAGMASVVQGSLLGSILSNLLLVLGMSFFLGGLYHHQQHFDARGASCNVSLLLLSTMAFMCPTVASTDNESPEDVLLLSRITAILLATIYIFYLIFQLGTHFDMFAEAKDECLREAAALQGATDAGGSTSALMSEENLSGGSANPYAPGGQTVGQNRSAGGGGGGLAAGGQHHHHQQQQQQQQQQRGVEIGFFGGSDTDAAAVEEVPIISGGAAALGLLLITICVSFNSDALVGSIEGLSSRTGLSENFIGVILLPIVGNAAEHATAVTVAIKNKPDLTIGVAVGSSTQIALFMVPFAVLVGWLLDVQLTLAFSKVAACVLSFSVLIVLGVVQDGESNWLEGAVLVIAYCIVAVVFMFNSASLETATTTASAAAATTTTVLPSHIVTATAASYF